MNKCVVCSNHHSKSGKTCSWRCAGLLAGQSRKKHLTRKRASILYSSKDKRQDIDFITKMLFYRPTRRAFYGDGVVAPDDRVVDECQKKILTFEGGGVFTKKVMGIYHKYNESRKRQKPWRRKRNPIKYFTSLDKDKKIVDGAMMEYSNELKRFRKNGVYGLPNTFKIRNYSLQEYLGNKSIITSDKTYGYNFVWLDYCGKFTADVIKDLIVLNKYMSPHSGDFYTGGGNLLFITLFKAREKLKGLNKYINVGMRDDVVCYFVNMLTGGCLFYKSEYKKMVTYGFATSEIYDDLGRGVLDNYEEFDKTGN